MNVPEKLAFEEGKGTATQRKVNEILDYLLSKEPAAASPVTDRFVEDSRKAEWSQGSDDRDPKGTVHNKPGSPGWVLIQNDQGRDMVRDTPDMLAEWCRKYRFDPDRLVRKDSPIIPITNQEADETT